MNENGYYIPPEDEKPESANAAETHAAETSELQTPPSAPTPEYDRKSVITRACSSGLFLAICILTLIYTIVSALPTLSFNMVGGSFGSEISIPVIALLITIGLWAVYNTAGKGEFSSSGMKLVSGSLKAVKICTWIILVLFLVVGAILIVGGALTVSMGEITENVISFDTAELDEALAIMRENMPFEFVELFERFIEGLGDPTFLGIFLIVLGVVFLIGSGVTVIYIIFFSYLYKFARTLREWGEGEGFCIKAVRGASNWLIVMGVFSCMGAMLFSLTSALMAAICIVTSVFIKRNFLDYAE